MDNKEAENTRSDIRRRTIAGRLPSRERINARIAMQPERDPWLDDEHDELTEDLKGTSTEADNGIHPDDRT